MEEPPPGDGGSGAELMPHRGIVTLHHGEGEWWLEHSLTFEKAPLPATAGSYTVQFDCDDFAWVTDTTSGDMMWVDEILNGAVYEQQDGSHLIRFRDPVRGVHVWPMVDYQELSDNVDPHFVVQSFGHFVGRISQFIIPRCGARMFWVLCHVFSFMGLSVGGDFGQRHDVSRWFRKTLGPGLKTWFEKLCVPAEHVMGPRVGGGTALGQGGAMEHVHARLVGGLPAVMS